jgi:hypothetical protein
MCPRVLRCLPLPAWRYWLIDLPARATEVGYAWYRVFFMALLWAAVAGAVAGLLGVTVSLALYFGFGIRWGW